MLPLESELVHYNPYYDCNINADIIYTVTLLGTAGAISASIYEYSIIMVLTSLSSETSISKNLLDFYCHHLTTKTICLECYLHGRPKCKWINENSICAIVDDTVVSDVLLIKSIAYFIEHKFTRTPLGRAVSITNVGKEGGNCFERLTKRQIASCYQL